MTTRQSLIDLARAEGIMFAEILEVPMARVWLLIPGHPTKRFRDRVDAARPIGVDLAVASFDDLDDIVAGLIAEAHDRGRAAERAAALAGRWWVRLWAWLWGGAL